MLFFAILSYISLSDIPASTLGPQAPRRPTSITDPCMAHVCPIPGSLTFTPPESYPSIWGIYALIGGVRVKRSWELS